MNMFGKLAEFMWEYQEEIELAFILILAVLAIFFIGRIVRANRRKREILSQINDTVTQISTAVSSISDKQSGVVYIDNRVGADARPKEVEAAVSQALSGTPEAEPARTDADIKECPPEAGGASEAAAGETAAADVQQEETERKEVQSVRKYFSRDCAVSKNGKYYTIEELNDQIRE